MFTFWLRPALTENSVGISEAYIISKDFVKENLKSPTTSYFSSEYSYNQINEKEFEIRSEVDSENSFGAKLRSIWIVKLRYTDGEWTDRNNWILENIEIYYMKILFSI
ncbi:hypothetical protein [Epilithonimonas zeae]|uniref:hypothetical protein n=1 Tax=Epilithonimonas zeae TaxID=1416779 RepID=UPI00200DECFA|nr:hypothetical protein [Epilithonimonas zeae]UQB69521.1 hypothetical protein KI430_03585 [Epilithonimonas zeae]